MAKCSSLLDVVWCPVSGSSRCDVGLSMFAVALPKRAGDVATPNAPAAMWPSVMAAMAIPPAKPAARPPTLYMTTMMTTASVAMVSAVNNVFWSPSRSTAPTNATNIFIMNAAIAVTSAIVRTDVITCANH